MRRKLAALLLAARSSAHINHDCTPSTRRLLDGVKVELRNVDDVWGRRVDGVTGESSRRASRRVGPGRLPCRRLDAIDWIHRVWTPSTRPHARKYCTYAR